MLNHSRELTIALLAFGGVCCGQPAIQGIFNGASYSGAVAPGTWVSIFGTSLAPSALSASSSPLPIQLNGVSVTVGGVPAPLVYVSPGQINAIIPFEVTIPTSPSTDTPVIVQTSTASSSAFNIRLSKDAPALFTQNQAGTGAALVFDPSFKPVSTIQTGTPIILYAVGLGATNPPASSSAGGATSEPFNRVQDTLSVFVGDHLAGVDFAGLAPGFPGIYQLNVVPNSPISDRVYLQQGGWQSNIASVPITGGSNAANVSGSIDGLYPATGANATNFGGSTGGPVTASVMLMAASFEVTFDIQPNAEPFSIVATSEAGTSIVNIDPVHSTYQASVSVPLVPARVGNFFNGPFLIYDFLSCSPSGCLVFPNNIIPATRLDPIQLKALSILPLPSANTSPDGMNSILVSSGTLPSSHVVLDSTSMGLDFGGFLQIAHPGATPRSTTFSLYVDGVLIATKSASYTVD
jgi:uncharacterized protein (TIGR03437 family)